MVRGLIAFAALLGALTPFAQPQSDYGEKPRSVRAVSQQGKSVSGVKVFSNGEESQGKYLGVTDAQGKTKPIEQCPLVALAPDGKIAFSYGGRSIKFGPTAAVRLHVTDDHNVPIAGQEIILGSSEEVTAAVRPIGYHWFEPTYNPQLRSYFAKKTDARGNVSFPNLPKGMRFKVITHFGPMFDPKLLKESYAQDLMDTIAFQGAAMAGRTDHVVIVKDRKLVGRITQFGTGAPIAGVEVTLMDTQFGHMLGYPGKMLRQVTTDSAGQYQFTGLPNCLFEVTIGWSIRISHSPGVIESKVGSGNWTFENIDISDHEFEGSGGPQFALGQPETSCDFRISKPATIHVTLKNPHNVPLKGWFLMTERGGRGIDESMEATFYVEHGTHTISLEQTDRDIKKKLATITVAEGTTTNLEFVLPAGIK